MLAVDGALRIADVALQFGKVERATMHPDGSYESDSTHTVMLCLLVAEVAADEGLDVGLAVQFAVVHDLVETYAKDTCTARGLSETEVEAKRQREQEAAALLARRLGSESWTMSMLARYERQKEPEARLVRYVDKITPKLTHLLNQGEALRKIGFTHAEMVERHEAQGAELAAVYPEFRAARALFEAVCDAADDSLLRDDPQPQGVG